MLRAGPAPLPLLSPALRLPCLMTAQLLSGHPPSAAAKDKAGRSALQHQATEDWTQGAAH